MQISPPIILFFFFVALVSPEVLLALNGGFDIVRLSEAAPHWLVVVFGVVLYFSGFIFFGVLKHVFLTMPLMRHYAETLTVVGADALPQVRQQARDEFAEAEGFAEALDVGAAL